MKDKSVEQDKNRVKIKKHTGIIGAIQALGMILYYPLMFVYLEVVFHWYMKLELKYAPIYIAFGIAAGLLFALFTIQFKHRINKIIAYGIAFLVSFVFCVEIICKAVLQQYYQLLSSAGTAANNKLTDYLDAIIGGIRENILGIVLMMLPFVLLVILGQVFYRFRKKYRILSVFVVGNMAFFYGIGILCLYLPWSGDFVPKVVYTVDTNIEDQVEQLGILTMLRLDIKHTVFGVNKELHSDFSDLSIPTIGEVVEPSLQPTINPEREPESVEPTILPESTPSVDTSPNQMNIDFASLQAQSNNKNVTWLHEYFSSIQPSTKNEYTGMFEGYNVIFVTMEGFSKYVIDEDRTPTLYKMIHEGFVFENYYTPLHFTSTSGGEFQNLTGLYPKGGMPISMKQSGIDGTNLYFSLANQLNRLGYESMGFHNNGEMYGRKQSHTNLGYDWFQGDDGFEMEQTSAGRNVWPQSDEYMIQQTVDQFIDKERFHVYYLTVSGHLPYNFSGDAMAVKHKSAVENLPYSEATKAYIAANLEVEYAMTYLLERLEAAGKLENTLIVMTPDHIPYSSVSILEELAGKTFGGESLEYLRESDLDFDIYKNTLVMWSGSMEEPVTVSKVCGQIDILPTISNLLGLEYDSRLLIGQDVLSSSSALVIFSSSSWCTDLGFYNRYSGEFSVADGVEMTKEEIDEYVSVMKKIVSYKLQASELIIQEDYYNIVFGE